MGTDKTKIDDAIEDAESAFWGVIAKHYPQIKTGDIDPFTSDTLMAAMKVAALEWLRQNTTRQNAGDGTASCELVVEMRPPKKGERGYWVEAVTAADAVEEILRECPEALGWVAQTDHDGHFDAEGMHAVTIALRKPAPALRLLSQDEIAAAHGFAPVAERADGFCGQPVFRGGRNVGDCTKPLGHKSVCVHGTTVSFAGLVADLPPYQGWRAAWEYPGFIAWHHPTFRGVTIIATPDWEDAKGMVSFDLQDEHGDTIEVPGVCSRDLPWPDDGTRSPKSYIAVVGPAIDEVMNARVAIERAIYKPEVK